MTYTRKELLKRFRRFRNKNKNSHLGFYIPNISSSLYNYKIGRLRIYDTYIIGLSYVQNSTVLLFEIHDGKLIPRGSSIDFSLLFLAILVCDEEDKI